MTKLYDIFEILNENDLTPMSDGKMIIIPNVALSKVTDLKCKLKDLDSDLEPLGYNRYKLIIPKDIENEEISTEIIDDSENDEESGKSIDVEKAAEDLCDVITSWLEDSETIEEKDCHCEECDCEKCSESEEDGDLFEVFNSSLDTDSSKHDFRKNDLASYLESFAGPRDLYEAQEDEYEKIDTEIADDVKNETNVKADISKYLSSEAEDVIDITEPSERQALIDLLVHNKEVLWGPTSSKIKAFRNELDSLDDANLEAKADDIFPEWKKHIKKYVAEQPVAKEVAVEEVEDEIEEAEQVEVAEDNTLSSKVLSYIMDNDVPCKFWDDNPQDYVVSKLVTVWDRDIHYAPYETEKQERYEHVEPLESLESIKQKADAADAAEEYQMEVKPEDRVLTEESEEVEDEIEEDVKFGPGLGELEDTVNNISLEINNPLKIGSKTSEKATDSATKLGKAVAEEIK